MVPSISFNDTFFLSLLERTLNLTSVNFDKSFVSGILILILSTNSLQIKKAFTLSLDIPISIVSMPISIPSR